MIEWIVASGVISILILILMAFQCAKHDEEIRRDKLYLFKLRETDNDDNSDV